MPTRTRPAEPHGHGPHGHSHGLVDRSITRSRDGLRAVAISLAVLLLTSIAQGLIFVATGSVALLADLIHNVGDALTAIPVGIAFVMRSFVAEKRAGYFVVAAIFVSACVAAIAAVDRLINPQTLDHLAIPRHRGRDRLRRQRDRRPGAAARPTVPRQSGADRRWQPRAD